VSRLLSLDPGLRACGVGYFVDGKLLQADLVRNTEKTLRGPGAWVTMAQAVLAEFPGEYDVLVVEQQQVYAAGKAKGDPADLLELAGVVGACTALLSWDEVVGVLPKAWKGQVPKEVHNARILKALSHEERNMVELSCAPSLVHNVIDSVGLGLWFLNKAGVRRAA
jgi:hypothetical protein